MYCAECGHEMKQREDGAYPKCCEGRGYWFNQKPLPEDNQLPVQEYKGFYLYKNYLKWPRTLKPKAPKLNGVQA